MQSAIRQYNWRGHHVAYVVGNTTIPCDEGNSQYRELVGRIERAEIDVCEPEIIWSVPTFAQDGTQTGYNSNIGFIPRDRNNRLYELLDAALRGGRCEKRVPDPAADITRINALIFSVVMERGWQHLAGPLTRSFQYKSNSKSAVLNLKVCIRNLDSTKLDALPAVFDVMGVEVHLPPGACLKTVQAGLLTIEFPVCTLLKLFRGERQRLHERIEPMLIDHLEMHYVMSGRNERIGPDKVWLMENAQSYLSYAVTDLANLALQEFATEYGGRVPGHVSELDTVNRGIVFAARNDGRNILYRFTWSGEHSFSLEGEWRERVTPPRTPRMDLNYVSSRVRQLSDSGFAMEALVVANSTFEVALAQTFSEIVEATPGCADLMRKKGHTFRLNLLEKLCASKNEPTLNSKEFKEFVETMILANDIRNAYLHQLVVPASDFLRLAEVDRTVGRVLPFIVDPHLSFLTLQSLLRLVDIAIPAARAFLSAEVEENR